MDCNGYAIRSERVCLLSTVTVSESESAPNRLKQQVETVVLPAGRAMALPLTTFAEKGTGYDRPRPYDAITPR